MIQLLFRSLWRFLIFLVGILIVWLTAFVIYPYADTRLPLAIIVLLMYAIFAYIIIPMLIRILRLFDTPDHIPLYAITPDGWPSDPVNIAVIATGREQLISAMTNAGWYQADPATLANSLKAGWAMFFNLPYPEAPFSQLYLFGRAYDIGFEKPTTRHASPRSRHHVRFWRLEVPEDDKHSSHFDFWHTKLKHLLGGKKEIWIGAAIEDTSLFGIRWRSGTITHQINTDVEAERDLIIDDLSLTRQIQTVDVIAAGEPLAFRGQTIGRGGPLICDGTLTVIELRKPLKDRLLKRASKQK